MLDNIKTIVSCSCFCTSRWSNFSWNIQNCGHKSETMWCMGLKICMGDKHHRYYKHTKFCQNLKGDLTISCWFDMELPIRVTVVLRVSQPWLLSRIFTTAIKTSANLEGCGRRLVSFSIWQRNFATRGDVADIYFHFQSVEWGWRNLTKRGAWQTFSCHRNETEETLPKEGHSRCLILFSIHQNEAG